MQQNSAHFEEGIVRSIQSAWSTFDEWQSRMSSSVQETWRQLGVNMSQLMPDREWISFAARSDHLLDPETPLRNPDMIDYPGKEDPSVTPVHSGLLERKKRFTKSYKEGFYVLTPAGYLHEYASSDPSTATHPIWSLFLPACTLGPPSSATTAKSHKFHIEARKDGTSAHGKTPGGRLFGGGDAAFTFRARSHEEMMEVWNDLRMLVARYLVASEQMERDGPVAHAVRSVGYVPLLYRNFPVTHANEPDTDRTRRTRRMRKRRRMREAPSRRLTTTEPISTRRLAVPTPRRSLPTPTLATSPSRLGPTATP